MKTMVSLLVLFGCMCVVWPTFGYATLALVFGVTILVAIAALMLGFGGFFIKNLMIVLGEGWLIKKAWQHQHPQSQSVPAPRSCHPTRDQSVVSTPPDMNQVLARLKDTRLKSESLSVDQIMSRLR